MVLSLFVRMKRIRQGAQKSPANKWPGWMGSERKIATFLQAAMIWIAYDDVIEHFDFQELAGANQIASHLDVRLRRLRLAAWMIMLCVAKVYV